MNKKIKEMLALREENHILPFLWMKGEDEATIREYMEKIHAAHIGAVCVESRPHPDFAGEGWWKEMDVILEEAKKRDMKVWILDDSHFPTGFANGAMLSKPESMGRKTIAARVIKCESGKKVELSGLEKAEEVAMTFAEKMALKYTGAVHKVHTDDKLVAVMACEKSGKTIDLTSECKEGKLSWTAPEGEWTLCVLNSTGNRGSHRSYINMLDKESCRVQIDAVYEPHWEHYKEYFGNTIAGFFSDEPEFGNGGMYQAVRMGDPTTNYPWSAELVAALEKEWGENWKEKLPALWIDTPDCVQIRYSYMDIITKLVRECFSEQLGNWCREHGVEYIGHVIEDNHAHACTGSSLGHYFRGLAGQDMAGIDDIGGQVLPYGEDLQINHFFSGKRDGEFFHFTLGKLAASLAAINPRMKGRAMCEIFGNYGWKEGLRMEKYLADHFLVRGVNNYVPHAFTMKDFPDPDCPPHFYAHGHNPQYRHFGELMLYMNRVCTMISGGKRIAPVAVIYDGEAQWTGKHMYMQKPGRLLTENQIEYDYVPQDIFAERDFYKTETEKGLIVNGSEYKALVVPYAQYVSKTFADAVNELSAKGYPVFFIDAMPDAYFDSDEAVEINAKVTTLEKLIGELPCEVRELRCEPESKHIHVLHYSEESDVWFIVNESPEAYKGSITIGKKGPCYIYDTWNNKLIKPNAVETENGTRFELEINTLGSCMIVFDEADCELCEEVKPEGEEILLTKGWKRTHCAGIDYPNFAKAKKVTMPDKMQKDNKKFSGFVRYETTLEKHEGKAWLEISDAHEGVELFVNGKSAGIQIIPPFVYDISGMLTESKNEIAIEVASTLEQAMQNKGGFTQKLANPGKATALSGITGTVKLIKK